MPKVDLVKELESLLPKLDEQYGLVGHQAEQYYDLQEDADKAAAESGKARERTTLQYADNPKELGSNEDIREARTNGLIQDTLDEQADAESKAKHAKHELEVGRIELNRLRDRLDLLKTLVEARKL